MGGGGGGGGSGGGGGGGGGRGELKIAVFARTHWAKQVFPRAVLNNFCPGCMRCF